MKYASFSFFTLKRIFPFMILLVIICAGAYVGYLRTEFIQDRNNIAETEQALKEIEWEFVETVLREDYIAAESQAKMVAEDFHIKTEDAYANNKEALKNEMDHPLANISPAYLKILRDSISNKWLNNVQNDDNDLFVCNREGIVLDLSRTTAPTEFPNLWENAISRHTNQQLAKAAIKDIFDQTKEIIYWDTRPDDAESVITYDKIEKPSIEALKANYMKYGLESLRYIQFLAPAYITDTGDIFGVDDIDVYGVRHDDNHKLVVVQTFNLYDQLTNHNAAVIERFNTFKEKSIGDRLVSLTERSFFITLVIILVIIMVYFMMVLNNMIFYSMEIDKLGSGKNDSEKTESKDKSETK